MKKLRRHSYRRCFLACVVLVSISAGAQSVDSAMRWKIQVIKYYQPTLEQVHRVPYFPPPDTFHAPVIRTDYDSTMPSAPPAAMADSLPAPPSPRIGRERLPALPRFAARVGGGNYATLYLDAAANTTYHPDHTSAIRLQHRSGHYGSRVSRFSHQQLTGGDERFLGRRKWLLAQKFTLFHSVDRAYGPGITENLPAAQRDSLTRRQWGVAWRPSLTKVRFRTLPFSLAPAGHFFSVGKVREWSAQFEGTVHDTFAQRHMVSLHTATEIYWLRYGKDSTGQRMRYQITPAYAFRHRLGRARVGFSAASSHEKKFYFFPLLALEFYARPDVITLFGGMDGRILPFDFKTAWQANPYLSDSVDLRFPVETFRIYGGVRATPFHNFYVTARVISSQMRNAPYYAIDTTAPPLMTLYYLTTNFVTFQTDFVYQNADWFGFKGGVRFQANGYQTLSNSALPWHLPKYSGEGRVRLEPLRRKVTVETRAHWMGQRPALDTTGAVVHLPSYFLWDIRLQYHYNRMISAHLLFENVTGQAYDRWYGYGGRKLGISGGLSVRF